MTSPMLQAFLSTALPIMITLLFGVWSNNKQLEAFSKRLDDLARRLDRIESILDGIRLELVGQNERIKRLEIRR